MLETADVISWRSKLKAGKNLPLRIYLDNNYLIDENIPLNYIKWDDDNGLLYVFRLSNLTDTTTPSNRDQIISVFSAPYNEIKFMEMAKMPLGLLDELFDSIGMDNAQFRENIKYAFKEALHPDRWRLDHTDVNNMTGFQVMDIADEYFRGRFSEPFKETRPQAARNEFIASQNKAQEDNENP